MKNGFVIFLVALSCAVGCKRNPIDRLVDPHPSGVVPQISGTYTVFDTELKTGGGLGLIPGGQNQSIAVNVADGSRSGRVIRYTWNGMDVSSTSTAQHLFAGFELLITPDFVEFDSAIGKDLSFGSYTKVKFFIRGDLSADTTLRVEGPDDGPGGITPAQINSGTDFTLTSSWQEVTLNVANPAHFNNVKSFITVTFQYDQPIGTTAAGQGGTVYLDDIRYEQ